MKPVLLFILLLSFGFLNAQHLQIHATAITGYEDYKSIGFDNGLGVEEEVWPFFALGTSAQYFFIEKPFFAELGININHSTRKYTRIQSWGSEVAAVTTSYNRKQTDRKRQTTYLGLPLSLGVNKEKFAVKIGLQLLLKLNVYDNSNVFQFVSEDLDFPTEPQEDQFSHPSNNLEKFIQVDLKFWEKFTLTISASHNSDSRNVDHIFPKYRFGIGCNYLLFKS